jgi:hypothetical protein
VLEKAKALEAAASELAHAGRSEQARGVFTRALAAYTALGASADLTRLHAAP